MIYAITTACTSSTTDEPDSRRTCTWMQPTWIDHIGIWPYMALGTYPALPDVPSEFNVNMIDTSIENSVSMPGAGGTDWDGNQVHLFSSTGMLLFKRSRFARNSCDGAIGGGGVRFMPPPAGELMPTAVFEDSEWIGNVA